MSYHSDRIYGIDISRYQHEKGRRRFPITGSECTSGTWAAASAKTASSTRWTIPSSFVYIKSTEGVTIENHYYERRRCCRAP